MTEAGIKNKRSIYIWNLRIDITGYQEILARISYAIKNNSNLTITYANANTLNKVYHKKEISDKLNAFDIIHPDGIGIHRAAGFLNKGLTGLKRMTGSDLYPLLINECINRNFPVFFFGHREKTLSKIQKKFPGLKICGMNVGYDFNDEQLLEIINKSHASLLIVGLGQFKQEEWILKNCGNLNIPVIIAVGDGIKVFAGTKIRGPELARKIGLEWLFRLLGNPLKYWFRYTIGNSLFLMRIIISKLTNFYKF